MTAHDGTVLLIDLSHLFWSTWHATADQELSAAFDGTVRRVRELAANHALVAVCCDAPPYKRREIHPAYKANREVAPPQAIEQLRRTKERLVADGFLLWDCPGYEADDVIATATRFAIDAGHDVTIATNDKDMLQLVGSHVRVLSTATGKMLDAAAVREKFGVGPERIRDLLALVGDKSDNVDGVPGIGTKTAAKLLNEPAFSGGLPNIIAAVGIVQPQRIQDAIRACLAGLDLAYRLVGLDDTAPINWTEIMQEREQKPLAAAPEWDDAQFEDAAISPAPKQESEAPEPAAPEPEQSDTLAKPTALAVRPQEWSLALEPNSSRDAWVVAKMLANSRLYTQFTNAESIFAVILRGRSYGLDATTSLASFHIIEGRPAMHADLIVGLVKRSARCLYFQIVRSDSTAAVVRTHRDGDPEPTEMAFTIDDAAAASLVTRQGSEYRGVSKSGRPSNWDKYRATMLLHRASTRLARAVYQDVVMGLYTPDELSDGSEED